MTTTSTRVGSGQSQSDLDDRYRAVCSADDLSLGSPAVRTLAERESASAADRAPDTFRSLGFDGGDAVLLVGAVDGSVARFLAETVRSVVVVATGALAELVRARCRSLSNVSVVASVADAAARRLPYDVILSPLGPIDPDQLSTLTSVIDEATMVVWAEHNPFAFDRLFDSSDRLDAGVSHAATDDAHKALVGAGLRLRSTLYPYPSLTAPTMTLAPPLFRHDDKAELFDLIAAQEAAAPMPGGLDGARDPDAAIATGRLRSLVLAGAARSLMPTRLVVASRVALPPARFDCTVAAWTFERGGDSVWCSMHRFVPVAGAAAIDGVDGPGVQRSAERLFPSRGRAERGWVSLPLVDDVVVPLQAPLQAELLRAIAQGDVEHIGTVLKQWRSALRSLEDDPTNDVPAAISPFSPAAGAGRIGSEWFDSRMANVALDGEGLRLLAQRFRLAGPVAIDLVVARSYWYLARDVIASRLPHPWSGAITVDELAQTFALHGGESIGPALLDRWRTAEADLLTIVAGRDAATHLARLMAEGSSDAAALTARVSGVDLRAEVERLQSELEATRAEANAAEMRYTDLQSQLALATDAQTGTIEDLQAELTDLTRQRNRQNDKIDAQSRLLTEVIRKYERAVHERNMVEQGMQSYRRVVTIAKRVMPTDVYFRVRKLVRGH